MRGIELSASLSELKEFWMKVLVKETFFPNFKFSRGCVGTGVYVHRFRELWLGVFVNVDTPERAWNLFKEVEGHADLQFLTLDKMFELTKQPSQILAILEGDKDCREIRLLFLELLLELSTPEEILSLLRLRKIKTHDAPLFEKAVGKVAPLFKIRRKRKR